MAAYRTVVMLDNPFALWLLNDLAAPAVDTNPTPSGPRFTTTGVHGTVTMANALGFNFGAGFPTSVPAFGLQSGGLITPFIPADLTVHGMSFEAWVNVTLDTRTLTTSGSYEQASTRLAPGFAPTLIRYHVLGWFPNIGFTIDYNGTDMSMASWVGGNATDMGHVGFGAWHHLAVVYAGAGSSSRINYIDGIAAGTDTTGVAANESAIMRIGEDERWNGYDTTIKGSIGGAAIYNYALTPQQVLNHANAALNNAQNQQQEFYLPFPTGFQPWDIQTANQLSGWITETYNNGGAGVVPAVGQQVLEAVIIGSAQAVKLWALPSAINPLG